MQTLSNAFRVARPALNLTSPGRILFVSSTPHQGGIERASVRLANDLAHMSQDHPTLAFACRPHSFTEELCAVNGVPTYVYSPRNSGDLATVGTLARIIRTFKPDIVHVHSRRDYLPATLATRLAGALGHQSALYFHCHLVRALGEPVRMSGGFFARRVDRILAVSQSVRANLLKLHPELRNDQVVVLPNSVDSDMVQSGSHMRAATRERWSIPDDALVIGMVGRLDAKGQMFLIESAPAIRQALPVPVRFLFVGGEGPAGFERTIRDLASEKGAADEVILTGVQENVAPYLSAMDLFAHLPQDEAFGLAIAEAMAARLPVVASLAPGCREIVRDGETGFLVDEQDKAQLTEAVIALGRSATLRAKMGSGGERDVRAHYSTESQIANLIGLYNESIKR